MCYRNRSSLAKTVKFTLEPFVELKKKKIICVENKQKTHYFYFQPQKAARLLFI